MNNYKLSELTGEIIGAAHQVHNKLGFGFLESVYEKALSIQLKTNGHHVETQRPIRVYFDEQIVGEFKADLIVNESVIVELKAIENIHPIHEVQLVNYLKSTKIEVGLLINFGHSVEVKRKIFSNVTT